MEAVLRRDVREMITAGSKQIAFIDLDPIEREKIHERVRNHVLAITMNGKVIPHLIVCKYCHYLFSNAKGTMRRIAKHLDRFHGLCHARRVGRPAGLKDKRSILQPPLPTEGAPAECKGPERPLTSLAEPDMKPAQELPTIQLIEPITIKEATSTPPIVLTLKTKESRLTQKGKRARPQTTKATPTLNDNEAIEEYYKLMDAIKKIEHSTLHDEQKMASAIPNLDQMDQIRDQKTELLMKQKAKRVANKREWRARKKSKLMNLHAAPVSK